MPMLLMNNKCSCLQHVRVLCIEPCKNLSGIIYLTASRTRYSNSEGLSCHYVCILYVVQCALRVLITVPHKADV